MKGNMPAPKGPYSAWVKAGGYIYVSGQGPVNVSTCEIYRGDIQEQTRLTLENVRAVLEDAGASFDNVIKTTVFLTNIDDFATVNDIYAASFGNLRPARSMVQVAGLPMGIAVEIDAVAVDPEAQIKVRSPGDN